MLWMKGSADSSGVRQSTQQMKTLALWEAGISTVEHWDTGTNQAPWRPAWSEAEGRQCRVGDGTCADERTMQCSALLTGDLADGTWCRALSSQPCSWPPCGQPCRGTCRWSRWEMGSEVSQITVTRRQGFRIIRRPRVPGDCGQIFWSP